MWVTIRQQKAIIYIAVALWTKSEIRQYIRRIHHRSNISLWIYQKTSLSKCEIRNPAQKILEARQMLYTSVHIWVKASTIFEHTAQNKLGATIIKKQRRLCQNVGATSFIFYSSAIFSFGYAAFSSCIWQQVAIFQLYRVINSPINIYLATVMIPFPSFISLAHIFWY